MYVCAISFDMPLDGEFCIDSVDIQQQPNSRFGRERLAIIPHLNFGCNGRVTSIRATVKQPGHLTLDSHYFSLQLVWYYNIITYYYCLKVAVYSLVCRYLM